MSHLLTVNAVDNMNKSTVPYLLYRRLATCEYNLILFNFTERRINKTTVRGTMVLLYVSSMKPSQQIVKGLLGLIEVKTIITITVILVFCYKTLMDLEITSEFVMIASAIVTYYFAKPQQPKNKLEDEDRNL